METTHRDIRVELGAHKLLNERTILQELMRQWGVPKTATVKSWNKGILDTTRGDVIVDVEYEYPVQQF
jgi:hypothetical protein